MTRVCTDLCKRLKNVSINSGKLPSHEALLADLCFSLDDRSTGRLLGTWDELQQRTYCSFCSLVVAAILHSIQFSNDESPPSGQKVRAMIFPGEQSFRLSWPEHSGLRLTFAAEHALQAGGPDTARVPSPETDQIKQIREWIDKCEVEHKDCLSPKLGPNFDRRHGALKIKYPESSMSNFRVLDLELGCITSVALDNKYVALSYVRGQTPRFALLKENFHHMSRPGSLALVRQHLPKTLNDAIDLVITLKQRYIWIDCLCLVQDDEDDVSLGVEMMNSIYHESYLTIIAGSGNDASAGLSGVDHNIHDTHGSRSMYTISPKLSMTYVHSIDWHLKRSTHNKRGWTLQELVLPRRTVMFLNNQVYFRCYAANWRSDMWSDHWSHWLDADDGNIRRLPDPNDGFMPSFCAYQEICEEYSRRKLRMDGEALRAVAGITRPLAAGMETPLVEGLPAYFLDHYLLFIAYNGDLRRRQEFGSFSWAGWEGNIMWPRENLIWFDEHGAKTWETTNILQHFKHHQLVSWQSISQTGGAESLSTIYDEPSPLQQLMKEHPTVFLDTNDVPERKHPYPWFESGLSGHVDTPRWRGKISRPFAAIFGPVNEDDFDAVKQRLRRRRPFSLKGLDLANGQAELDRLLERLEDRRDITMMYDYGARLSSRGEDAERTRTSIGPRPISDQAKQGHYSFRCARDEYDGTKQVKSIHENQTEPLDGRVKFAKMRQEQYASNPDMFGKHKPPVEIPTFPPYPILKGLTISLHLTLGGRTAASASTKASSSSTSFEQTHRLQGIPLLSASNKTVGSLHPDNIGILETSGNTKIELAIIARCKTPTNGSALWQLDSAPPRIDKPWDLLWVLHVIWIDGIAERRGVGQILTEAIDDAVEPLPRLKTLLLG